MTEFVFDFLSKKNALSLAGYARPRLFKRWITIQRTNTSKPNLSYPVNSDSSFEQLGPGHFRISEGSSSL